MEDSNKGLSTGLIIGIVIVVLGIAGIAFAYYQQKTASEDAMMEKEGAMMEDDADAMMEGDSMMKDEAGALEGESMMKDESAMMSDHGSYEVYAPEKLARAEKGTVVLFFRASWCPTCRTLDADIRAHLNDIPAGVTILDVDYDKATALKQKYGITTQHTLVAVDKNGTALKKWGESPTLAALVAALP